MATEITPGVGRILIDVIRFPDLAVFLYVALLVGALNLPTSLRAVSRRVVVAVIVLCATRVTSGVLIELMRHGGWAEPGRWVYFATRWVTIVGWSLIISAIFLQRPPAATVRWGRFRLGHLLLLVTYVAIVFGYSRYIDLAAVSDRYGRSWRYIWQVAPFLVLYAVAGALAARNWRRCPRACFYLLAGCHVAVISYIAIAMSLGYYGRGGFGWRSLRVPGEVGLMLSNMSIAWAVFAGREDHYRATCQSNLDLNESPTEAVASVVEPSLPTT